MEIVKERLGKEQVQQQARYFSEMDRLIQAFDVSSVVTVVINSYRQILYANKAFCKLVGQPIENIIGNRPGESIGCIHSKETEYGCGTAEACKSCGVLKVIIKVMNSRLEFSDEAIITCEAENFNPSINLMVHSAPISVNNEDFYVVSFMDISDTVRRRMLERVFFHDILNTAGALKGLLELMKLDLPDSFKDEVNFVEDRFMELVEEIRMQRQLLEAENGELVLEVAPVISINVINNIVRLYKEHETAANKNICIAPESEQVMLNTDYKLLKRVLGNMLKNALEATDKQGSVTVGCKKLDEGSMVEFWVHNNSVMNSNIKTQLFQRSFSTKGYGRGIGTYSMKLFGEKYLRGKVGFTSEENKGTRFHIQLPI